MQPNASDLEELYKDVHCHPELSLQEHRNGEGPTVMLRAALQARADPVVMASAWLAV